MNEDFIKQFRRLPDSSFVEKMQIRLERKEQMQAIKRHVVFSALALIFAVSMLVIFSSTARAEVVRIVEQTLICNLWPNSYCGDGILTINPSEYLSLDDAQAHFIYPVVLPKYVPQSFERAADTEFFDLPDQPTLVITWDGKNHVKSIKLLISRHSIELENYARTLGKGAIEETTLDGKPAIIVRGTWNIGTRQNDFVMTAIMWRYDKNTVYSLLSLEQAIPLDELIRMAESIP